MATKRDSKDPMPTARNTERNGGGNEPTSGEKHGQSKAERVGSDRNRSGSGVGPSQPTRQGGGNTSVTGEMHNSAKAERVSESARW